MARSLAENAGIPKSLLMCDKRSCYPLKPGDSSDMHLVILLQGGDYGIELIEVEPWRDLGEGEQPFHVGNGRPAKDTDL